MNDSEGTRNYALDDIAREFLKYAPAYAQEEAKQAIGKIMDLQTQGVLRNGLYYIVLVDLVGSTEYMAAHGNEKAAKRIENFVITSFKALNQIAIANIGLFVKEIGDAVLYIFQHFPDIILWRAAFDDCFNIYRLFGSSPPEIRTCIHLGEVFLEGVNPLSLAVSQTFKTEKSVGAGEIVLTEPAYTVAWPTIARAYHGFESAGDVELDGFPNLVPLHRLVQHGPEDLMQIHKERLN